MKEAEARALQTNDQVAWDWTHATCGEPTPGTVTSIARDGVYIYWSDSEELPTFYPYDDPDSWPSITKHCPDRAYIPDQENAPPIQRRKKTKK